MERSRIAGHTQFDVAKPRKQTITDDPKEQQN
jgi:hypothetical protein